MSVRTTDLEEALIDLQVKMMASEVLTRDIRLSARALAKRISGAPQPKRPGPARIQRPAPPQKVAA